MQYAFQRNAVITRWNADPSPRRRKYVDHFDSVILLLVFGFGGYRLGPGLGYYGGGGISLIILIVIILLLLKVI